VIGFQSHRQHSSYKSTYRVAEESNRMGLRPKVRRSRRDSSGEMITEGVRLARPDYAEACRSSLFVEQQTTGGYAKIANVIADLHSVGQLRPRERFD